MTGIRKISAVIAAAFLLFAITACGSNDDGGDGVASLGSDDSSDSSSSDTSDKDMEEQALEFAACMRENGVDMPDPEFGEDGGMKFQAGKKLDVNGEAMERAMEACEDKQPDFGGNLSEEDKAEMQDRALDFAECMRGEGIDMPDPDFSGGGVMSRLPEGIDPEDPTFQKAQEKCQDEVGMGGFGTTREVG